MVEHENFAQSRRFHRSARETCHILICRLDDHSSIWQPGQETIGTNVMYRNGKIANGSLSRIVKMQCLGIEIYVRQPMGIR